MKNDKYIREAIGNGMHIDGDGNLILPDGDILEYYKAGYPRINIKVSEGWKNVIYSRVVCWIYHGPPPTEEYVARHKDGDKYNSSKRNLIWLCGFKHKSKHNRGAKNPSSKLLEEEIPEIRRQYRLGFTQDEIAKIFGVAQRTVSDIINLKTWAHIKNPIATA